jgi:hypothetical protein
MTANQIYVEHILSCFQCTEVDEGSPFASRCEKGRKLVKNASTEGKYNRSLTDHDKITLQEFKILL